MPHKNYSMLLGVHNKASVAEIKSAFRTLAKKYHPDKNIGNKAAEDVFKEIQQAYSILSDSGKRRKYDKSFEFSSTYYAVSPEVRNKKHTDHDYYNSASSTSKENNQKEEKFDKTEGYQFILSISIAILLLYFIVSYSLK